MDKVWVVIHEGDAEVSDWAEAVAPTRAAAVSVIQRLHKTQYGSDLVDRGDADGVWCAATWVPGGVSHWCRFHASETDVLTA